jgi:hypothetical protein
VKAAEGVYTPFFCLAQATGNLDRLEEYMGWFVP